MPVQLHVVSPRVSFTAALHSCGRRAKLVADDRRGYIAEKSLDNGSYCDAEEDHHCAGATRRSPPCEAHANGVNAAQYVCAGVGVAASFLNAYNVFKGPGTDTVLPPAFYTYFGMFMAFAFGLGFVIAPEFLSRMKTKFDAFDGTHLFYGRFIGCNMVVFGITLAFILDTAGAFKATGVWMTLAVLFGPTYACIAMDPVMTPDGVAGDPFLILIAGIIGFLGTM